MCLIETRPSVLVMFSLRFAAGATLGAQALDVRGGTPWQMVGTGLVWVTAIFAVYLFNGVMDVTEDRANGSARPIARGELEPDVAFAVARGAALLSLAGAALLPSPIAWMVLILLALGYAYSGPPFHLKRRSGPAAAIGMLACLLTYAAGFVVQSDECWVARAEPLVVFTLAVSLWTGLVGILTKDLSDIEGDAEAGRSTLGVTRGEETVRLLAAGAALATATAFGAVVLLLDLPLVGAVVTMFVGAIVVTVVTLGPLSRGDRAHRRRPYRAFMTTQYGVHLILVVVMAYPPVA
ncbi:UbiA family prenyltransferase [Nonomuraea sp. NPDC000554]|uniref:UbiA family prenyltransferase n=1 Tax=Nonomuraea sp. NPDC000554 TaxID=3154259 RepID=UPI0033314691